MAKLHPVGWTITQKQLKWLKEFSEKTGLNIVEIVRRALDAYADAEAEKERRHLLSPQQRADLRKSARARGLSETEIIRSAVTRELRHLEKLRKIRKEDL